MLYFCCFFVIFSDYLYICGLIHPGRLTSNPKMEVWKIMFLSTWVICRFHLNLPRVFGGSKNNAKVVP